MAKDLFGLEKEGKIRESRIRDIFTPHMPIESFDLFFGRQDEVKRIIQQIGTPGQHSLLYGDRGVGKSSLANIATQLLIKKFTKGKLYTKRCGTEDTFASILDDTLTDLGLDINIESVTFVESDERRVGISHIIDAGGKSSSTTQKTFKSKALTPSRVSEYLADKHGLLYIDEFDRIPNSKDKHSIAELIKLLSDCNSPFKILVVGIAKTATELIGAHASVQRCLKETKLNRMDDKELTDIVIKGALQAKLKFMDDVTRKIVRLSSGYPHFTHLLALKCAEYAIANDLTAISMQVLEKAIQDATNDAEGSLKDKYDHAIRSFSSDVYKDILLAAALIRKEEFKAREWREMYYEITNKAIKQSALNNYLQRLVSNDETCIVVRLAKGVYRFTDPRMPSYVQITNAARADVINTILK